MFITACYIPRIGLQCERYYIIIIHIIRNVPPDRMGEFAAHTYFLDEIDGGRYIDIILL